MIQQIRACLINNIEISLLLLFCLQSFLFYFISQKIKSDENRNEIIKICLSRINEYKLRIERKLLIPWTIISLSAFAIVLSMSGSNNITKNVFSVGNYLALLLLLIFNRNYAIVGVYTNKYWQSFFKVNSLCIFSLLIERFRVESGPKGDLTSVFFFLVCIICGTLFVKELVKIKKMWCDNIVLRCTYCAMTFLMAFCALVFACYFLPINQLRESFSVGLWINAVIYAKTEDSIIRFTRLTWILFVGANTLFIFYVAIYNYKKVRDKTFAAFGSLIVIILFLLAGRLTLRNVPNYFVRITPSLDYQQVYGENDILLNERYKIDGVPVCVDSPSGLNISLSNYLQSDYHLSLYPNNVCTIRIKPIAEFNNFPFLYFFFKMDRAGEIKVFVENQGEEDVTDCTFYIKDDSNTMSHCFTESALKSSCERLCPLEQHCIFVFSGIDMINPVFAKKQVLLSVIAEFDSVNSHWKTEKELPHKITLSPWDLEIDTFGSPMDWYDSDFELPNESEFKIYSAPQDEIVFASLMNDSLIEMPQLVYNKTQLLEITVEYDNKYTVHKEKTSLQPFIVLFESKHTNPEAQSLDTWNLDAQNAWYEDLANDFLRFGMYNQAIRAYNDALELNPGWVSGIVKRGDLFSNLATVHKGGTALPLLEKSISDYVLAIEKSDEIYREELQKKLANCYYEKGEILLNQGKTDEALNAFYDSVRYFLDPEVKDHIEEIKNIQTSMPDYYSLERNMKRQKLLVESKWSLFDVVIASSEYQVDPQLLFGSLFAYGTTVDFSEDNTFEAEIALHHFSGRWTIENGVIQVFECSPDDFGSFNLVNIELQDRMNGDAFIILSLMDGAEQYQLIIQKSNKWYETGKSKEKTHLLEIFTQDNTGLITASFSNRYASDLYYTQDFQILDDSIAFFRGYSDKTNEPYSVSLKKENKTITISIDCEKNFPEWEILGLNDGETISGQYTQERKYDYKAETIEKVFKGNLEIARNVENYLGDEAYNEFVDIFGQSMSIYDEEIEGGFQVTYGVMPSIGCWCAFHYTETGLFYGCYNYTYFSNDPLFADSAPSIFHFPHVYEP